MSLTPFGKCVVLHYLLNSRGQLHDLTAYSLGMNPPPHVASEYLTGAYQKSNCDISDFQPIFQSLYRGADKFLARPGRKQAAPVKSMMGR